MPEPFISLSELTQNAHYIVLIEKDENKPLDKINCIAWVLIKVSVDYHNAYGLRLILKDIDSILELERQRTLQRLLSSDPKKYIKKGSTL